MWQLNMLFAVGLINFKRFGLKTLGPFKFQGHGKKVFLKKLYVTWIWGILLASLVECGMVNLGVILKIYFGDWSFKIL